MAGPEEQRLVRALSGAAPEALDVHRDEWNMCAGLLVAVARQVQATELPIPDGDAGGLTASAMNAAFATAAAAMTARSLQLREGRDALGTVASALQRAQLAYAALGPERSAPTYTPDADPQSEEGIKVHNAYLGQLAAFQADQQHREEVARQQNEQLDAAFASAQRTMQEIHGEKKDDTTPPAYSGATAGGGGSTSGGGGYTVASGGGAPTSGGTTHSFHAHSHTGHHAEVVPGGDHVAYSPGGAGDLSSPSDAGTLPASAVVEVGGEPGSGGLGLGGGAGIAGGAAAGILGARLGGALKGGLFGGQGVAGASARSAVVGRGTTAGAVRGIGTSSRSGTSGTLGRSGSSSASGRSGSGATGRSGSGGRSSGATGRGGRGKDDRKRRPTESFDVGEDWVGDDDAAPGVLD